MTSKSLSLVTLRSAPTAPLLGKRLELATDRVLLQKWIYKSGLEGRLRPWMHVKKKEHERTGRGAMIRLKKQVCYAGMEETIGQKLYTGWHTLWYCWNKYILN